MQTLTGSSTDPTTSPQALCVVDGDTGNAADLNSPIQPILNYIAWLRANAALLGAPNTFTASETFNAAVTMLNLLTLSQTDLKLTAAAVQQILKTGGTLKLGTGDANDVQVLLANVLKWTFRNSDGALVSAGGKVTGLPTPGTAGDAAVYPVTSAQMASGAAAANLGFTPVQQGTGTGQGPNAVKIGWDTGAAGIRATVDSSDMGFIGTTGSPGGAYLVAGRATTGTSAIANQKGSLTATAGTASNGTLVVNVPGLTANGIVVGAFEGASTSAVSFAVSAGSFTAWTFTTGTGGGLASGPFAFAVLAL